MKRFGFLLVLLLSFAGLSVLYLGVSMKAQEADPLLLFTRYNEQTSLHELYVVNANTVEERLITTFSNYADAGWTPDGRIWVVAGDEDERHLTYYDALTGEASPGIDGIYPDPCFPAVYWSPNGEQMAYLTGLQNNLTMNWLHLSDGASYQWPVDSSLTPYWSPDSHYFLLGYRYSDAAAQLYSAEDGNVLLTLPYAGDFSPDSRYFVSSQGFDNSHLYLHELATGESVELTGGDYGVWSPNGRYFGLLNYGGRLDFSYYDTQAQSLENLPLNFSSEFAAWTADESAVLLYANFYDYSSEWRPTKLIRYELASGEMETLLDLDNEGWIGGVYRNGDWLAIRYSLTPPGDHYSPTTQLLFLNGESRYETELEVDAGWLNSSISSLPNASGFLIHALQGLYFFDSESGFQTISTEISSYPLWTADGSHVAFIGYENGSRLRIWHKEDNSISLFLESAEINQIIGWQGSRMRQSLLYCGEG